MQQTLADEGEGRKEPMQPTSDVTVLEYVTQSDAYRNRLLREHAGSLTICASRVGRQHR
jgi:hypothetical protein